MAADSELSPSVKRKQKSAELIKFDGNHGVQYQGYCKLQINVISKFLYVEPVNEGFKDITATFDDCKFIKQKNIIFVANASQDFALVFNDEEKCSKVLNAIFKNRKMDDIDKRVLQERFVIQIFRKAAQDCSSKLNEIIQKWIQKHDKKERKKYFQLLKEYQDSSNNNIQEMNDLKNVKQEMDGKRFSRKRKRHQVVNVDEEFIGDNHINGDELDAKIYDSGISTKKQKSISSGEGTKIIDESKFQVVNIKYGNGLNRTLLIFTADDKTHCHEYTFFKKKNAFYHRCNTYKRMKAILVQDENGNDCIKLEDKKHICSPLQYTPEKYVEMKIVKNPDYEIIENYSTQSKRMLVIFDPSDRNQCYEYYWCLRYKRFQCRGCSQKKKHLLAEVCHENSKNEYIRLISDYHVCEIRKYNSEKYFGSNKFILSPNFKDGKERKTLIIFDEKDRKLCYYYSCTFANTFYCKGCLEMEKRVSAKLCQNSDGEEYVIFSNAEHVCSLRPYISQIILLPPRIKFIEATDKNRSKLLIFDSNNSKMCHTFTHAGNSSKRYYCQGCTVCNSKNKNVKGMVTVYLYQDKETQNGGEYCVKMMDGQEHICKPRKYEKFEKKILQPNDDYILFQSNRKNSLCLAVYHSDDKKLCYQFCYYMYENRKQFECMGCHNKKAYFAAKIQQDSDGNEYIVTNQKKHVCKPIKISLIIKSDTVILENSGLSFEKEPKKEKEKVINESRILRLPNFQLLRNRLGAPEKRLIVFQREDRTSCFEYCYSNTRNFFTCKKCFISAKVETDGEKNEKYLILSKNEHTCEPVKYEPEKEIIEASDFILFNRDDESKPTKLVVFTSSTKEFCYVYTYSPKKNFRSFCCKPIEITAKLLKDPDGKEYIQLSKNEHVCTPKKFVLEEFQPTIVPESGFKLFSNKNGRPNSKLILFDSKKDGYVYEYRLTKVKLFLCNGCLLKKKNVGANLREKENGEKYLELSPEEHACKSTKYDMKKMLEKKVILENLVVQSD